MAAPRPQRTTDLAEEAQLLDAIGKWLDRDVKPHVAKLEHGDIYPAELENVTPFRVVGVRMPPSP